MTGKTDVAHLSLLLCFDKGLERAVRAEDLVDLLMPAHLMTLPEVKVIRIHALQGQFELAHCAVAIADLGLAHEQHFVAQVAGKRLAVGFVARTIVVLVGAVEEIHAEIDGPVNDANAFIFTADTHVVAAHCDARNVQPALTERRSWASALRRAP